MAAKRIVLIRLIDGPHVPELFQDWFTTIIRFVQIGRNSLNSNSKRAVCQDKKFSSQIQFAGHPIMEDKPSTELIGILDIKLDCDNGKIRVIKALLLNPRKHEFWNQQYYVDYARCGMTHNEADAPPGQTYATAFDAWIEFIKNVSGFHPDWNNIVWYSASVYAMSLIKIVLPQKITLIRDVTLIEKFQFLRGPTTQLKERLASLGIATCGTRQYVIAKLLAKVDICPEDKTTWFSGFRQYQSDGWQDGVAISAGNGTWTLNGAHAIRVNFDSERVRLHFVLAKSGNGATVLEEFKAI